MLLSLSFLSNDLDFSHLFLTFFFLQFFLYLPFSTYDGFPFSFRIAGDKLHSCCLKEKSNSLFLFKDILMTVFLDWQSSFLSTLKTFLWMPASIKLRGHSSVQLLSFEGRLSSSLAAIKMVFYFHNSATSP